MHIWMQKIVWSGKNGCHVSQEDVCKLWAALHPVFTDAYSKIRIPEDGKHVCENNRKCINKPVLTQNEIHFMSFGGNI